MFERNWLAPSVQARKRDRTGLPGRYALEQRPALRLRLDQSGSRVPASGIRPVFKACARGRASIAPSPSRMGLLSPPAPKAMSSTCSDTSEQRRKVLSLAWT